MSVPFEFNFARVHTEGVNLMERVDPVSYEDLSSEIGNVVRTYGTEYGSFGNQAQVLAHVPPAAHHLAAMLM